MTGVPIMIIQLLLSLSFLVIIHECGHFFPAKWFKTRVEKFYLFFDPWFSIFRTKKGDTEYGIGWLPLGGYVKISGMVDESFDTEKLKEEPKPWEFRSKPAWQRLIIMLGGVTVNFIAGFLLFALILGIWGEQYLPNNSVSEGIVTDSIAREIGLRDGDKILKVGDKEFTRFEPMVLRKQIGINNANSITVIRDGQQVSIPVDERWASDLSGNKFKDFDLIGPRALATISAVEDNAPAQKAGILAGDQLIAINDQPAKYWHEYRKIQRRAKSDSIIIKVSRNQEEKTFPVLSRGDGTIGFTIENNLKIDTTKYGFFEAIPAGVTKGMIFMGDYLKSLGNIFKGKTKASESLGGFASITKLFPKVWDWEQFIRITAVLSLILAVMNLLPIPGLDGGHVIFLLFEMVTGKKLSDKFVEKATMVGFFLLIALMVYANGLDVFRIFKK